MLLVLQVVRKLLICFLARFQIILGMGQLQLKVFVFLVVLLEDVVEFLALQLLE